MKAPKSEPSAAPRRPPRWRPAAGLRIEGQRRHRGRRQAVVDPEAADPAILVAQDAAAFGAGPEHAARVDQQRVDRVLGEQLEGPAVETGEAGPGAHPEQPVRGLGERPHRRIGQAVRGVPAAVDEAVERRLRPEAEKSGGPQAAGESQSDQMLLQITAVPESHLIQKDYIPGRPGRQPD